MVKIENTKTGKIITGVGDSVCYYVQSEVATNVVIKYPLTINPNDYIFIFLTGEKSRHIKTPLGWTLLENDLFCSTFYKIYEGNESSYQIFELNI